MTQHAVDYPIDAVADDIRAWVDSSLRWEQELTQLRAVATRPVAPVAPLETVEPATVRTRRRPFHSALPAAKG